MHRGGQLQRSYGHLLNNKNDYCGVAPLQDNGVNLNSGFQTDLVLLDFKKAFDKVPHHRLCYKLAHYGIKGTTLRWIQDFLTNRTQQVVVNECSSSHSQVISKDPSWDPYFLYVILMIYLRKLILLLNFMQMMFYFIEQYTL